MVSDSLKHHGLQPGRLLCPWNSPDQNTRVGNHFILQRIFPTQESNPGLLHYRQILYQLSHREAQEYWSGQPIPSPGDLPHPGNEPGFPALQADSLPTELSGKPQQVALNILKFSLFIDILLQHDFDQMDNIPLCCDLLNQLPPV